MTIEWSYRPFGCKRWVKGRYRQMAGYHGPRPACESCGAIMQDGEMLVVVDLRVAGTDAKGKAPRHVHARCLWADLGHPLFGKDHYLADISAASGAQIQRRLEGL